MNIEKRVKKLEQQVAELLANKPVHGQRLQQIANFIMEQFETKDEVACWKIFKRGREKGFSTQMMQRARRELLREKIEPMITPGKGWSWAKNK